VTVTDISDIFNSFEIVSYSHRLLVVVSCWVAVLKAWRSLRCLGNSALGKLRSHTHSVVCTSYCSHTVIQSFFVHIPSATENPSVFDVISQIFPGFLTDLPGH